jgi:hypothetical protein
MLRNVELEGECDALHWFCCNTVFEEEPRRHLFLVLRHRVLDCLGFPTKQSAHIQSLPPPGQHLSNVPQRHTREQPTKEGSKNLISALNIRSKFFSLAHISSCNDGTDRDPLENGDGLDGYPGLAGEEAVSGTGFSTQSRASFCKTRMLTSPCSRAVM